MEPACDDNGHCAALDRSQRLVENLKSCSSVDDTVPDDGRQNLVVKVIEVR